MAINDDIHHTDMNWVGILCYQISPFPAPFHFRRSIFGNKADICWSPEQLDTRFTAISSEFVALLLADGGIFLIFSQKTDSRSSGNDTPLV